MSNEIKITSFDDEGNDLHTVTFTGSRTKAKKQLEEAITLMKDLGIDPFRTVSGFHISEQIEFDFDKT